jgi:hypothetical protein
VLERFDDEYEAGRHREEVSEYHEAPNVRRGRVAWVLGLLFDWNERERAFPRQGENRSLGERTPDWAPITDAELAALIAGQLEPMEQDDLGVWLRIAIEPFRVAGARQLAQVLEEEPAEAHCVARSGNKVIVYDDLQDVFATGRLDAHGNLGAWDAVSEDLVTAIYHFKY